MAWSRITFFEPSRRGMGVVMDLGKSVTESLDSSGTSQVTTATSPHKLNGIVRIHAGSDIWVNVGASPTALEGEGAFMASGEINDLAVTFGDVVAIIDA